MAKTRIITFANQKGGVAKTTTTLSLGAELARLGRHVLLVDADPQANLTAGLGLNPYKLNSTIYDVLQDPERDPSFAIYPVRDNLDVLPSTLDLAAASMEFGGVTGREMMLRDAVNQVAPRYDYVLIDPQPSLELLTINAIVASTEVIIPLQPHPFAMRGISKLAQTVSLLKKRFNLPVRITGVILTIVDTRTNLAKEMVEEAHKIYGGTVTVYQTYVPYNTKLAEASGFGKPISEYDPHGSGTRAYRQLAKELDNQRMEEQVNG